MPFWYTNFQKSPMHPSPDSLRSLALAPMLKNPGYATEWRVISGSIKKSFKENPRAPIIHYYTHKMFASKYNDIKIGTMYFVILPQGIRLRLFSVDQWARTGKGT